jgi:hypothetical protein
MLIIKKKHFKLKEKFHLYSIINLQSLWLWTWELKVQLKKIRVVCSYEFIHISEKEASQKKENEA